MIFLQTAYKMTVVYMTIGKMIEDKMTQENDNKKIGVDRMTENQNIINKIIF